jgi:hypothetical protein
MLGKVQSNCKCVFDSNYVAVRVHSCHSNVLLKTWCLFKKKIQLKLRCIFQVHNFVPHTNFPIYTEREFTAFDEFQSLTIKVKLNYKE